MIRDIIKKVECNEMLCPEGRDIANKIGSGKGPFTLKRNDGEEFTVEGGSGVIGGFLAAVNSKGKGVALDLCGKYYYKVV